MRPLTIPRALSPAEDGRSVPPIAFSSRQGDEPITISVNQLAAKLAHGCASRRALVIAAFKLCPKDQARDDLIGPSNLELANYMFGAVSSLLRTQAESRRTE